MKFSWFCVAFLYLVQCQDNCKDNDPIFCDDSDAPTPEPEPGSDDCTPLNELNDVDTVDLGLRQAVHVCEDERGNPCSAYADLGFVCVPVWNCRNNLIITDGNGIIDVRSSSLEEKDNKCGVLSGTLDI